MRWSALWITVASSITARAYAECGDNVIELGVETCDDGNLAAGDGCNASCQIEAGYVCSEGVCCFQDAAAAYALLADASLDPSAGIITLTPDAEWKEGTAWYRRRLDFTTPFTISVRLYLGTRDGAPSSSANDLGADGGALLFQRDPRGLASKGQYAGSTGEDGGELGAKGVAPVVGVEFDTYSNGSSFGDVVRGDEDHTSVFQSGTHPESNQIAPAVCMNDSTTCSNFEDGRWHRLDVSWTGDLDHHLSVFIDGVKRIELDEDLVRDHFNDDPTGILFGFAANTGGHYNQQRFCPLAPYGFGVPRDADQDAIDDALDGDTDGDGASDSVETGNLFGAIDPDLDDDVDGVPNYRDVDSANCADLLAPLGACDALPVAADFDRDGIADHLDLDSDADATPDASDSAPRDPCLPARTAGCPSDVPTDAGMQADASVPSVDAAIPDAGKPRVEGPTPGDLDGDQVGNEVDPAPDDPCKPNRNALACATGDADGDKLNNEFECPGLRMCRDTDGDGVSDYADGDSDGDGSLDAKECPDANACPDKDGDGTPDLLQPVIAESEDGCSLARSEPLSLLWLALLMFSARIGWYARSATARACGARRSPPSCRAAHRPPPATPRSS